MTGGKKMRKILLVALVVTLGILCFASTSLAKDNGFGLYLDYSQLSWSVDGYNLDLDADYLTLGCDYAKNGLLIGGFYSASMKYDPDIDISDNILDFYAGYDFMKDDNIVLGVIGSYMTWNIGTDNGWYTQDDLDVSALGIGFKAAGNFDKFSASFTYIYGIDTNIDYSDGSSYDDANFNYLELTGSYYFNDLVGLSLKYRSYKLEDDFDDITIDGLALGVNFKF
jgi:hypothetical protein